MCYFLFLVAHAQDEPPSTSQWTAQLSWFLPTEQVSASERAIYTQTLLAYTHTWAGKARKAKNDRAFLEKLFNATHRKFLKKYQTDSPFYKAMRVGKYDCVSSVALFALLLEYTGYTYQIYETPNHAYLKVQTSKGEVLLETTNRAWGFVKSASEIQAAEKNYQLLACPQAISLKELAGLQFYNQALSAMKAENYAQGTALLRKAKMLYNNSERIKRLGFLAGKL